MTPQEILALQQQIGQYALNEYQLELATNIPDKGPEAGKIYIKAGVDGLRYDVMDDRKNRGRWEGLIPWDKLPEPHDIKKILENSSDYLPQILEATQADDHTYTEDSDAAHARVLELLGHPTNLEETLYKNCPEEESKGARKEFIDVLAATEADESKDKVITPPQVDTRLTQPDNNTITMKELLGAEGLAKYKKAVKEEAKSRSFRDAVLLSATKDFKGPKWGKQLHAIVVGASGVGKTFACQKAIKELEERGVLTPPPTHQEDGPNRVVFIDGGIEREVAQMRQLVLQLAIKKGYTYISDLQKKTKLKIKKRIKSAVENNKNLNTVTPVTCSKPLEGANLLTEIGKYEEQGNTVAAVINVTTDRFTTAYQGTSRAAYKNFKKEHLEKYSIKMNNRHIGCESKIYEAEFFDQGVKGSEAFIKDFLKTSKYKTFISVKNDRDLFKQVTINNKTDLVKWTQNEQIYLVSLKLGESMPTEFSRKAEEENTPILVKQNGRYSIYGNQNPGWDFSPLEEKDCSDRELEALNKLSFPERIPEKGDLPPDKLDIQLEKQKSYIRFAFKLGAAPRPKQSVSSTLIKLIQKGHRPEIIDLSKRDYKEWQDYKANNYIDLKHRLPKDLKSPKEWLAAYRNFVGLSAPIIESAPPSRKIKNSRPFKDLDRIISYLIDNRENRMPTVEIDKDIGSLLKEAQVKINALSSGSTIDTSDIVDRFMRLLKTITEQKNNLRKISNETVGTASTLSATAVNRPLFSSTPPKATISTGDLSHLKNIKPDDKVISFKAGDKEYKAVLSDRTASEKKSTSSDIVALNENLDTATCLAQEAMNIKDAQGKPITLFNDNASAKKFFKLAIKNIRKKYGGISADVLEEVLREKFGQTISEKHLAIAHQHLSKTYLKMTEQLDLSKRGERYPSDAFLRLAKHHYNAHVEKCNKMKIDKPTIQINTDCWDPHYVTAIKLINSFQEKPLAIEYDSDKGWDIAPISDLVKQDFSLFYKDRFGKLDQEFEAKNEVAPHTRA